ncbi:serologically defined colon cancer antigen 8 homolog isoform X2 [Atheta coriaria]|uniref:serologically defined colon cancer antigen 8 homolog isoform X2 n=1 Tax=Dalotia coriaria TaxID=877792 RepID=UPI0031F33A7B
MHSGGRLTKDKYKSGSVIGSRMGALKNLYSSLNSKYSKQFGGHEKKKRNKKSSPTPKMDFIRKKPDYADTAYHEAVGRLRILLAESYSPRRRPTTREILNNAGDDTDNQSVVSVISRVSKYPTYNTLGNFKKYYPIPRIATEHEKQFATSSELSTFLERQEDYIDQLERESRFCREELSTLLGKVKEVIQENENLHEKQKDKLLKTVFDQFETELDTDSDQTRPIKSIKETIRLEGPSIMYESRISELEAKLTQARIDLKKSQEGNEQCHRKHADYSDDCGTKKQLESLKNDNTVLQETVTKLQTALNSLRDKEHSTTDHVKRSLDIAEQAQYEKNAAEHEIRRLKDELERQHGKLRDALNEQSRRVADERTSVERRYSQQIEQLSSELGVHWEQSNKLQLELDKHRRENADLRRELAQKQAQIDELKKEMQSKIITLQSDIGVSGAEKSALEQQIATLQMGNERTERQSKQESARNQVEMQSLRQRLDRADADLIHSRRENLRLTEQIAALEKEINMNNALADEKNKINKIIALPAPKQVEEKEADETAAKIQSLEAKHVATVAELEGMIQSQNQLMDKLSAECHALTQKLEESSSVHKVEIQQLQANLEHLSNKLEKTPQFAKDLPQTENVENVEQTTPQPASTEQENFTEKDPNYYNQNQYDNQQYDESGAAYPTYPEGNYEEQQQYMSQEQYDQQYGQYDPNSEQGNFEESYKENQESSEVAKDDQPAAPNQTS